MDVAKEFKAVDFKIKMQIRRQALEALARIEGIPVEEYIERELAEQREAVATAYRDNAYQVGYMFGTMQRALNEAVEGMAAGIRAALGR